MRGSLPFGFFHTIGGVGGGGIDNDNNMPAFTFCLLWQCVPEVFVRVLNGWMDCLDDNDYDEPH